MAAPATSATRRGTSVGRPRQADACERGRAEQVPRHEDIGAHEPDDGRREHRKDGEERAEPGRSRPASEGDGARQNANEDPDSQHRLERRDRDVVGLDVERACVPEEGRVDRSGLQEVEARNPRVALVLDLVGETREPE